MPSDPTSPTSPTSPSTTKRSSITLQDIESARERIRKIAVRTPLKPSSSLSEALERDVYLKLETAQPTGAFKLRGATNAVLSLSEEDRRRGVITMSSGNHGRALAFAAKKQGIHSVVCVSEQVPAVKVDAIRRLGAEVLVAGKDQDQATAKALQLADERGLCYISPFDNADVIAGQGTIGLEILEQCPEVDTLVVQVSGGGLISGIAIAARALRPDIKILGVSQEIGPAMYDSLRAGHIVEVDEQPSLADALQGGMPADNRYTFDLCRRLVDQIFLVSEAQLGAAMVDAFLQEKLVIEGGAAATLAALADPEVQPHLGSTVAAIITGDNVDPRQLLGLIQERTEGNLSA